MMAERLPAKVCVDRWFSRLLAVPVADLTPGMVAVASCPHCTFRHRSEGFIRLVWAVHFGEAAAVAVHPAAAPAVARLAWGRGPHEVLEDGFWEEVKAAVETALPAVELRLSGLGLRAYHPGGATDQPVDGVIRPLVPDDESLWQGPRRYQPACRHPSVQTGDALGLFLDGRLVGEIITHESVVSGADGTVVEEGIEVHEEFRRQGYGRALLAAWTVRMQARGVTCLHGCSLANVPSVALARSAGYLEYCRTRSLNWSPPAE